MTQKMKRKYVKPQMEVYMINKRPQLLQSSPTSLPIDPDTPPTPWQW